MVVCVIPCAGEGTRMRPLSYSCPKALIPVLGKPLLVHIVEQVASLGIDDVILVVSPCHVDKFEAVLGLLLSYVKNVHFVLQEKRLGLAHAVAIACKHLRNEPILVYLGDNYFKHGSLQVAKNVLCKDTVTIFVTKVKNPERFGYVIFNENGMVVDIIEKPSNPPPNGATLTGLYYFPSSDEVVEAFSRLRPSQRGEYEIVDLIKELTLARGRDLNVVWVRGWWKDVGTPTDLLELLTLLLPDHGLRSYVNPSAKVSEKVQIGEYVDIEENVTVSGDGTIHHSIILPRTRINLQNAKLENAVIGEDAELELLNVEFSGFISARSRLIVKSR